MKVSNNCGNGVGSRCNHSDVGANNDNDDRGKCYQ